MLIGMGGGAASSMATGANIADLDFDSVQRGNAEIQRRAQEVIDRCWQLGRRESDPVDPRRRRGRTVERAARARARRRRGRARSTCARFRRKSPAWRRARSGATRRRSATCSRSAPSDLDRFARDLRARALPVRGRRAARTPKVAWSSPMRSFDNRAGRHAARLHPRQAAEDDARRRARRTRTLPPLDLARRRSARRGVPGAAVSRRGRQDVPRHDRRSHRRRPVLARPDGRSVAGAGRRRRGDADGFRRLRGRGDGDGRAHAAGADRRAGVRPRWRSPRRSPTSPRPASRALGDVKLSANWMAPAGHPGEDAALYDTVRAVALELCASASASVIPVGKDSMSMRTTWRDGGVDKAVTAPVSLIVSAFAPVADARRALTPLLAPRRRRYCAGADRPRRRPAAARRLGARAGLRPARRRRARPRRSGAAAAFFAIDPARCMRKDGGCSRITTSPTAALFATLAEMAFASRCGLEVALDAATAMRWRRCSPKSSARSCRCRAGAVTSSARRRAMAGPARLRDRRARRRRRACASRSATRSCSTNRASISIAPGRRRRTRCSGCATTRTPPTRNTSACWTRPIRASRRSSRSIRPTTSPRRTSRRARGPRVAILREQGVNGQVEMAAAFDRAGFDAYDVHMSDLARGPPHARRLPAASSPAAASPTATCWARARAGRSRSCSMRVLRDDFAAFFARADTFALGVCNGCQMMSNLHELDPRRGALAALRAQPSPSSSRRASCWSRCSARRRCSSHGMEGSRIPVATAHGEGLRGVPRRRAAGGGAAARRAALRRPSRRADRAYPYNPNGSPRRHHRAHDATTAASRS